LAPHSDASAAGEPTTLGDLAKLVGGTLEGDEGVCVRGVAGLDDAGAEHLSFCALPEYRRLIAGTEAAAVIVGRSFVAPRGTPGDLALIRVDNPYLAVATVVRHFFPETDTDGAIHPSALIDPSAELGSGVAVEARAVIGPGCRVGSNSRIGAGCVLADGTVVGADCTLHPNVTIYRSVRVGDRVILHAGAVVGSDGFGYALDAGKHLKIPQVGGVVIEDDVEVGANTCIDRGALGDTRIARGAKIDNLVQIGHNCEIGPDSVLCGQAGLGGSTVIGKGVMIGGQAGLRGHLKVGDGVMVAGGSGVTSSVPAGTMVAGYPGLEVSRWRRAMAALKTLPRLVRRVRRLEAVLEDSKKENE
jgi:UDP-3-O-[3-hydroxymyristoyl] glucosamine N-acyltransferase